MIPITYIILFHYVIVKIVVVEELFSILFEKGEDTVPIFSISSLTSMVISMAMIVVVVEIKLEK